MVMVSGERERKKEEDSTEEDEWQEKRQSVPISLLEQLAFS